MVAMSTTSMSAPSGNIKTMAERLRKASNNCAPEKMWAMLQAALAAPNVTGALAAACDVATPRCQQPGKPQRSDSEEEEELEQAATRRRRGGAQQVEMATKTAAPMTAPRKQQPVAQQKDARKQSPAKQRKAAMRSKGSLVPKSPKAKRKVHATESAQRRRAGQQQSMPWKCKLEAKDTVPCTPATKRELVDLGDFEDILELVQAWVQTRSSRDTKPPRPRTQSKCGTEPANKRAKREQPGRLMRLGRTVIHGIIDLTEEECRQQRRPRQSRQQQQQQQHFQQQPPEQPEQPPEQPQQDKSQGPWVAPGAEESAMNGSGGKGGKAGMTGEKARVPLCGGGPKRTDYIKKYGGQDGETTAQPITTMMLKNIPCRKSQEEVMSRIDQKNFTNRYDFFYLPRDVKFRANLGYAFINFLTPQDASAFKQEMDGFRFSESGSTKACAVVPAHVQGLMNNLAAFRRTEVMRSSRKPYFSGMAAAT
mmetsp:Transcript_20426/g.39907  ORF Transcript_20426/g.39907 Transcript_20426/m.39907 type:complete len:479 (-) Transcript_20426:78-1514(-)